MLEILKNIRLLTYIRLDEQKFFYINGTSFIVELYCEHQLLEDHMLPRFSIAKFELWKATTFALLMIFWDEIF